MDINLDNIDKDGWAYGVDFSSFKDENCGSKVKGAMHFVRRRRWVRFQYFDSKLSYSSRNMIHFLVFFSFFWLLFSTSTVNVCLCLFQCLVVKFAHRFLTTFLFFNIYFIFIFNFLFFIVSLFYF